MNSSLLRDRLHKEIDQLPDEIVEQIANLTSFLMGHHNVAPLHDDWEQEEWQHFAWAQFFREEKDDVEYTIKDAKEIYQPETG
jgi:hypothetical protein